MNVMFRLLSIAALLAGPVASQDPIPFDSPRWNGEAADFTGTQHLGRESILLRGGEFLLADADFTNGVIEYDVALPRERGFIGVIWRWVGPGEHEHFYLRPHQTGQPDACQYTPVLHGISAWQLYTGVGYSRALDFAYERWTHVKIVVWEDVAWIYVDSDEPVLVSRLGRETSGGTLGVNVGNGFAPAYFADFRYRSSEEQPPELAAFPPPALREPAGDRRLVTHWDVSSAFAGASLAGKAQLEPADTERLSWSTLEAEPSGLANLARVQGIAPQRDTCFARIVIESPEDVTVPFELGFSDSVRVYLNGAWLYEGRDPYRSRDERFLGTIGFHDTVPLQLRAGRNELLLAVTEIFGGWGVQGSLPVDAPLDLE